jgi:hypothetical protein
LAMTQLLGKKKEMWDVQSDLEKKRHEFFERMQKCQEKEVRPRLLQFGLAPVHDCFVWYLVRV